MIHKMLWLAAAGGLGTLARYGLAGLVHRIDGASFPWGTITVNVGGCFAVGLLAALFENRWPVSGEIRLIVLVGFMGGFTTFSAYMLETSELVRSAEWLRAAANVGLQNILGFAALVAGAALGRFA
ncbi:MAG: CrcB family protein [Pirellulales bacterium]|nr:CrcB family protein [Pirellulales bacterium]